jgi:hypothetical protein
VRDPHVERLHYRLQTDDTTSFAATAQRVRADTAAFTAELADDRLLVGLIDHYSNEAEAREAVEPYLQAWEIKHALRVGGRREAWFEFDRSEIVDRNPPPPGTHHTIKASASVNGVVTISVTGSVARGAYPLAPTDFVVDPDTLTLWNRWQGYLDGREPLQSMAYFCLTVLELHGGRAGAAAKFGISRRVLDKLGQLASERGDPATARKALAQPVTPTAAETHWLEAAVRAMIRRVGEVAADPTAAGKPITLADLPEL